MKILVTGGGGFLGQALCRGLVGRGHQVVSFNRGNYPVLRELGAVSYTHRDVYKRQPQDRQGCIGGWSGAGCWAGKRILTTPLADASPIQRRQCAMTEPCNIAASLPRLASEQPGRVAMRCPDGAGRYSAELTYAQLDARSDALAAGLVKYGLSLIHI